MGDVDSPVAPLLPSGGRLSLAATPLGQPSDASARLVTALGSADVVAAEDTRRVRTLANALGVRIAGKVVSLFDQNEAARVPALIAEMKGGATVLAVTDAGMPLLSDPGYRFCFEGFAPRKRSARRAWLATLAAEPRTCVFFESPRRLAACLADAVDELGPDRRAAVCRELTKVHEEVVRGTLSELAEWAADGVLGEITVVLAGATRNADVDTLVAEVELLTSDGMGVKDACQRVVAAHPGAPSRRELY